MRAMNSPRSLALLLAASLLAGSAWASTPATKPAHESKRAARAARAAEQKLNPFPNLGDVQSFEVQGLEAYDFSAGRQEFPPELAEYIRTAILNDNRLHYSSPGQGILRLSCDNTRCSQVRAEVTNGTDGGVVWKAVKDYSRNPLFTLDGLPNARQFANKMVEQLAQDYEKSLKATPTAAAKIQIKEE
jgi:hypothetical protein